MTTPRTAAQQAIGLICSARLCEVNSMSSRQEMLRLLIEATDILRAALAEPVQEPVWVCPDSAEHRYQKPGHCEDCGKTLAQVAEPTTEDSSAVEPVAWMVYTEGGTSAYVTDNPNDLVGAYRALALYTSPPK